MIQTLGTITSITAPVIRSASSNTSGHSHHYKLMPGILLPQSSAMKRHADDLQEERPAKRMRRVRHGLKFRQPLAKESASRLQDVSVFQSQLLRSIILALSAQGFDSVESSALESFRAITEECMYCHAHASMVST